MSGLVDALITVTTLAVLAGLVWALFNAGHDDDPPAY